MSDLSIPWHPRIILVDRLFRLPIVASDGPVTVTAPGFKIVSSRWDARDGAWYYYLRTPTAGGDYCVKAGQNGSSDCVTIQVRTLSQLREPTEFNSVQWPRRWKIGKAWESTKRGQTLQDRPVRRHLDEELASWWSEQSDTDLWRQLPYPEFPQAHFVNVNQGCPSCGTAVFKHGGFYPWSRSHLPLDYRSMCPSCGAVCPSNDFLSGDFTSGDTPDDGFGHFDYAGHVYLFNATYHRDQVNAVDGGIQQLTARLRGRPFEAETARSLAVLLVRYAWDILYLAAVPQFRYGPSMGEETPWVWGQPDWASETDPVGALFAKGMRRYAIDIPYVSESLALAYDTIWPFLIEDSETVARLQALGLDVDAPSDVITIIEEMLAAQLQCIIDRGARSNLPRESMGALCLLRCLDRTDAHDVMDWLYDEGPDRLRVFGINDFFPDGTPPESTGGYNGIHTNGLFELEYHLRALRQRHPEAYSESRYPSLVSDPRAPRVARAAHEVTMAGRTWFQFGDGSAPGCKDAFSQAETEGALVLGDMLLVPHRIDDETLERAAEYTDDPVAHDIQAANTNGRYREIGTTVHDGVGIAILRSPGIPERAALGIAYGDTTGHRHMDLLDVQLIAFERPFLTDLGYPQSWASVERWEANWATHNSVWGSVPDVESDRISGRGRLIRCVSVDGIQILEVAADRWFVQKHESSVNLDSESDVPFPGRWQKTGVSYRRLVALVETENDGVAVVDLSRITGGNDHWRTCRGLHGGFSSSELALSARSGNVLDASSNRGDESDLPHSDYAGLAWMDDVQEGKAGDSWSGCWQSTREPDINMDIYQTGTSPDTEIINTRATATMGTPEESSYEYRTLIWRRRPGSDTDTTSVDLVFEPRTGGPTLSDVHGIASDRDTARGVSMTTTSGRCIRVYWAPDKGDSSEETTFSDGTRLKGSLGVFCESTGYVWGDDSLESKDLSTHGPGRIVRGIHSTNRNGRTIDVTAIPGIAPGDRLVVNPRGRGHSYRVESVEDLDGGYQRITLDVTCLLGRSLVRRVSADRVDLEMAILARTGNLNETWMLCSDTETSVKIVDAVNPDRESTALWISDADGASGIKRGDWIDVVDYVAGDEISFEPRSR